VLILRKPSTAFIEVAKVWHEDEDLNHKTGFGRGSLPILTAKNMLESLATYKGKDLLLLAIWLADEQEVLKTPIGYTLFYLPNTKNRVVDVHLTLGPAYQGQGYGTKALELIQAYLFSEGAYRLEFQPMKWNKPANSIAKAAGFVKETVKKASAWTPDGPQDQTLWRLTLPEWKKLMRKRV